MKLFAQPRAPMLGAVTLCLAGLAPVPSASRESPRSQAGKPASGEITVPDIVGAAARSRSRELRLAQRKVQFTYFSGGSPDQREVTLTFDDGPHPVHTPRILDILRDEGVPATFFIVGENARRYPQLVRRTAAEGHDLGNHTYHHYSLATLDRRAMEFEIRATNQVLTTLLGGPTRWFRAPGCRYPAAALEAVEQAGMVRVDTTCNSGDWDRLPAPSMLRRTFNHLSPGDVILCHDRMENTVEALPELIRGVRERGYRFVSLAELALDAQNRRGFQPEYWPQNEGITLEGVAPPRAVLRYAVSNSRRRGRGARPFRLRRAGIRRTG